MLHQQKPGETDSEYPQWWRAEDARPDYQEWWHKHQLSKAEWRKVTEGVIDGHEKVAPNCPGILPVRAGRQCKDGHAGRRQNGYGSWLDPNNGFAFSVTNMHEPENNEVAKYVLKQSIFRASNLIWVVSSVMRFPQRPCI